MKIFVYGSIGIVALTIVFGFYVAGSPGTERALRFDQTRISDLSILQSQIVNYWQTKQKLPAVLSDLENDISGFRSPTDPETGVAYEYRITGDKSFELCATFKMEDSSSNQNDYTFPKPIGGAGETWQHGAGRQCFSRTIDSDLYPPFKKGVPTQ